MKTYKYISGTRDDDIDIGDYFLMDNNPFIVKIDEHSAIVNKLKSIPDTYKVIGSEEIVFEEEHRVGYKCKCLTTNKTESDY